MAEVNNITNIAREIVSRLDAEDKKSDGKIEASIWNKFVCNKQGNEVRNYISSDNALKSVIAYLKREAAKTGQAIEDIANEWLGKFGGNVDKKEIDSSRFEKEGDGFPINYIDVKSLAELYGTDEYIEKMQQNPNDFKKLKEKCAEIFEDSCQLLFDVANNNYRYKITRNSEMGWSAELADGRTIEISLYKDPYSGRLYPSIIKICDNKKDISLSNEGGTIFITGSGVNSDSDYNGDGVAIRKSTKDTSIDMWKIAEKIFGDDLRKTFGDDLDFYRLTFSN